MVPPFCFSASVGKARVRAGEKSLELSCSLSVKCVGTVFVAPTMRGRRWHLGGRGNECYMRYDV